MARKFRKLTVTTPFGVFTRNSVVDYRWVTISSGNPRYFRNWADIARISSIHSTEYQQKCEREATEAEAGTRREVLSWHKGRLSAEVRATGARSEGYLFVEVVRVDGTLCPTCEGDSADDTSVGDCVTCAGRGSVSA